MIGTKPIAINILAKSAGSVIVLAFAAAAFDGRNTGARKQRVSLILETMLATGSINSNEDGTKYFATR